MKQFLNCSYALCFSSFAPSGREKSWNEKRGAHSVSHRCRVKERVEEQKKTSERGKGAQFTLEGGYILSCLCICYLFIQLPESAVHLGWVWCLHVFVSCLNVSVVCMYVRACVPGVRPQPPFEEHIILSESSTASRSSFPSLSFFPLMIVALCWWETHQHICVYWYLF